MATKTILKKTQTEAVVKVVGSGAVTVSLAELAITGETVLNPKVDIHQARWSGAAADTAIVVRGGVDILRLTGSGDWEFNGYNINEQNTGDLTITLSANTTAIITLRKVAGYTIAHRSYLTGGA
jgi:hypothetical protein